jgi:hypothetical protein
MSAPEQQLRTQPWRRYLTHPVTVCLTIWLFIPVGIVLLLMNPTLRKDRRWWAGAVAWGLYLLWVGRLPLAGSKTDTSPSGTSVMSQDEDATPDDATPSQFARGPNGQEILVGGDGVGTKWYFHYYLDKKGDKVMHGKAACPVNIDSRRESLYENGTMINRTRYGKDGNVEEVLTRRDDGKHDREQYRPGSSSPRRSVVVVKRTSGGETIETVEELGNDPANAYYKNGYAYGLEMAEACKRLARGSQSTAREQAAKWRSELLQELQDLHPRQTSLLQLTTGKREGLTTGLSDTSLLP